MNKQLPPRSASSFVINCLGGLVFLSSVLGMHLFYPHADFLMIAFSALASGVSVIVLCELLFLKVHKRPHVGLTDDGCHDSQRVRTKLAGFFSSLLLLFGAYCIIPEYDNTLYLPSFLLLLVLLPFFIVGGLIYIREMDSRLKQPCDKLWHFGCFVVGKWKDADMEMVRQYTKSLLLRGYFLPVMLMYLVTYIDKIMVSHSAFVVEEMGVLDQVPGLEILKVFLIVYFYLAAMDVFFASVGYIMAFRFLDSDIRSTEPTFLGWFICIICYFPFWELMIINMFLFELYEGADWRDWFQNLPVAFIVIWGSLVVLAMFFESLSTLSFGIRFSNLTYRGLISSGPFYFTKHPQYIAKLCNRFFYLVPFLSLGGVWGAVEQMMMFGFVCFVYYLRARTEENHLSRFPEYVDYANWMNENGIFRWAGKIFPFLVYSEAKAKARKLF